MARAKGAGRKCRSAKTRAETKEEDQKVEEVEKTEDAVEFENEEQSSASAKCARTGPFDEEDEEWNEELDAEKNKSSNTKKKSEVKSNRGKRNAETQDNTEQKGTEEVSLQKEPSMQQVTISGKGKKKVLKRKAEAKEEVKMETDDVAEEVGVTEDEPEKASNAEGKDGINSEAKIENKRSRRKKNESETLSKKAKEVSTKKDENSCEATKDVVKRQDKRCNRNLKRGVEEQNSVKAAEVDETAGESKDNLADFRCIDHQTDKSKKSLCFKLLRSDSGKGEKVMLLTSEEAKKIAASTCFDYMVDKILEFDSSH